jgi:hypothetical protein
MSLSALAVLVLAVVLAIYRALRRLPLAVWSIVKRERNQDDGRALDTMKEAVAVRAGQAVIAIQTYQEQIAHSLRAQIAEAETRTRIAERRAADTATALEAASTLVRELRAALEAASGLTRELGAQLSAAPPRPPLPSTMPPSAPPPGLPADRLAGVEDTDRKTIEMPSPPASASGISPVDDEGGFGDDAEQTRVADRPAALALVRRARLIPLPGGAANTRSFTLLPPAPVPRE